MSEDPGWSRCGELDLLPMLLLMEGGV
uniref:Uncharacterized protein n=1 Tax=Arundo donax TaxID=35708 RepID=A0A0A9ALS3_ARUDO